MWFLGQFRQWKSLLCQDFFKSTGGDSTSFVRARTKAYVQVGKAQIAAQNREVKDAEQAADAASTPTKKKKESKGKKSNSKKRTVSPQLHKTKYRHPVAYQSVSLMTLMSTSLVLVACANAAPSPIITSIEEAHRAQTHIHDRAAVRLEHVRALGRILQRWRRVDQHDVVPQRRERRALELLRARWHAHVYLQQKVFEVHMETFILPTLHTYRTTARSFQETNRSACTRKLRRMRSSGGLKAVLIFMNVGFASFYVGRVRAATPCSLGDAGVTHTRVVKIAMTSTIDEAPQDTMDRIPLSISSINHCGTMWFSWRAGARVARHSAKEQHDITNFTTATSLIETATSSPRVPSPSDEELQLKTRVVELILLSMASRLTTSASAADWIIGEDDVTTAASNLAPSIFARARVAAKSTLARRRSRLRSALCLAPAPRTTWVKSASDIWFVVLTATVARSSVKSTAAVLTPAVVTSAASSLLERFFAQLMPLIPRRTVCGPRAGVAKDADNFAQAAAPNHVENPPGAPETTCTLWSRLQMPSPVDMPPMHAWYCTPGTALHEIAKRQQHFLRLLCLLARGRDHQRMSLVARRVQSLQNRDGKHCGLACAELRLRHQIAILRGRRDRALLDC
ncbi:hypothetical protein FI667_g16389, partial [Globisporangium splendens]